MPMEIALTERAEVIALALRESPQLRAVRWNIERARGRLEQSGRMENPELSLWGRSDVAFTNEGEYAFGVSLSQAFPLAARLHHERAASRAQLEAAEAEVQQNSLLIVAEAVAVWRNAIEAQARLRLLREQEAVSQSNGEMIREAVTRGERSVLDADQAELESLALRTRIHQAESDAAQAQAALRQVLGAPEHVSFTLPEPLPLPQADPLKEWHRVNVDTLPAVRGAAALVNAADAELAQARARSYGDITVALDFEQGRGEDVPVGKRTDRYLGLSVSVPLPVWNTYDGSINEYTAARRQAEATLAAERYRVRSDLSAISLEVSSAFDSARLVQEGLLQRARESAQRMEQGWRQGEIGLTELLRARSNLIDIELEALRLGSAFHRALDRHAAASGQLLSE